MSVDRPKDYFRIVRENAAKTRGFILAERPPCLGIRDREVESIHRDLLPAFAGGLADLEPRGSWLLAVILCPGDDTRAVAAWAARLSRREVDRVRFYAHPEVDLVRALAAWVEAGLPAPRLDECGDWREFHRQFGLHLNDLAHGDAAKPA